MERHVQRQLASVGTTTNGQRQLAACAHGEGQRNWLPKVTAHRTQQRQCPCRRVHLSSAVAEATSVQAEDKWIEKTLKSALSSASAERLERLHQECIQTLQTQRMPSTRNEEYRYTDVSSLLRTEPQAPSGNIRAEQLQQQKLAEDAEAFQLVVVNGRLERELSSKLEGFPQGVFIGSLANAPSEAAAQLGSLSRTQGGPFAVLNGALAEDVVVVAIEKGVELSKPIHIIYYTTGADSADRLSVASPRLLVHLASRASCQVVEEFAAAADTCHSLTNAVAEIHLAEEASLKHGYVELESSGAWHFRASLVQQARKSQYTLTETQLGGRFSRHDLDIQQVGRETETVMRAFLLSGPSQLHDLHSKLRLEHPGGVANQLHKCIVSASSGRGVFDGNVKVQQLAQQTDAAQLSRNLLLVPKATVNVKPNLQIVADDVKCSHGCTVSDLEEEQLFYFRTRGVDDATARQVLVYSFGSEVTQHLKHPLLLKRIQEKINSTLAQAPNL